MAASILVVDDEPSIRKVLATQLRRDGHDVRAAASGEEALDSLSEASADVVITDLKMPGIDGLALLDAINEHHAGTPVILITAFGTVNDAVEALKRGAYDFIAKPFDLEELRHTVQKAIGASARAGRALTATGDAELLGRSEAMQKVWAVVDRVASSPATVLIMGESGTGKEVVARELHRRSSRSSAPFIQVHCGAIPEALFEQELFGSERDTPDGPLRKPGRVELADGGTLFLDEVEALPRDLQVKLLGVLQHGTFEAVGGRVIRVNVRVVAAADTDLRTRVADGAFREDLYYRLNVIPLQLAPLRQRADDLPELVRHLIGRFNERLGTQISGIHDDALALLAQHAWPGNLRELENVLERSVLLAEGELLGVRDLSNFRARHEEPPPDIRDGEDLSLKDYLRVHTERLERHRLRRALSAEEGNVTRAARRLGISRRSLQTKMKEYGLRER